MDTTVNIIIQAIYARQYSYTREDIELLLSGCSQEEKFIFWEKYAPVRSMRSESHDDFMRRVASCAVYFNEERYRLFQIERERKRRDAMVVPVGYSPNRKKYPIPPTIEISADKNGNMSAHYL